MRPIFRRLLLLFLWKLTSRGALLSLLASAVNLIKLIDAFLFLSSLITASMVCRFTDVKEPNVAVTRDRRTRFSSGNQLLYFLSYFHLI